ncbi:plasminogen receptor (KT)-like [Tubulanus polymorphus]|uniref:plasminogen receptor (KT)-like n=1 Tax=Tubulanus polymorphus TaxID=672921 RepID=UPI003DA2F629
MGSIFGKAMDENLKKNQEFMLRTQQLQMERQLNMQNLMRERMMAAQLAKNKDIFYWFSSFYAVALMGLIRGYSKAKNPAFIGPLVPLTFILGYQIDLNYGNKLQRIRDGAETILKEDLSLISMPGGVPTFDEIEERRGQ